MHRFVDCGCGHKGFETEPEAKLFRQVGITSLGKRFTNAIRCPHPNGSRFHVGDLDVKSEKEFLEMLAQGRPPEVTRAVPPTCTKDGYDSESTALSCARTMTGMERCSAYFCSECGRWHLTTLGHFETETQETILVNSRQFAVIKHTGKLAGKLVYLDLRNANRTMRLNNKQAKLLRVVLEAALAAE